MKTIGYCSITNMAGWMFSIDENGNFIGEFVAGEFGHGLEPVYVDINEEGEEAMFDKYDIEICRLIDIMRVD